MNGQPDDLDTLIAEAREGIEAELRRERREIAPDFVAVVAAAHARNPEQISATVLREVGEFAPIVELGAAEDAAANLELDAEIDAMVSAARERVEGDVAARRLAGIPPVPTAASAKPASREFGGWAMAVALAAVVAGLAVGVPRLLEAFVNGNYTEAESSHNQAEYLEHEVDGENGAQLRSPPARPAPQVQRAVPGKPPAQSRQREGSVEGASSAGDKATSERSRKQTNAELGAKLRDRVAELEAKAQAHWAAGELALAQTVYRQILAIAGRSRYADLAYGDLFTLARQRGDLGAEQRLWREYLSVFPRGRFAEDARVGLCRRAPASEREACWRSYLADFPQAVHAAAARQALTEAEKEPSAP
jgi:hypothetical protein